MLTQKSLDFLGELAQNNHRDWFEANKKRFESEVKKPFETLVARLIDRLPEVEGTDWHLVPSACVHRIYRDTRFSKDKTPYKTHVSAVFSPGGKKGPERPGYYFQVAFGELAFFGGAYMLEKEPLWNVRNSIVRHADEFAELLADPVFVENFGTLKGERNQRIDLEFREAAAKQPLIFQKQFYVESRLAPQKALGEGGADVLIDLFRAMKPMNDFLRKALENG